MPYVEPPLTYLMPISSLASWAYFYRTASTGAYMLPVAAFGFAWAGVNTLRLQASKRPGWDKGLVTFGAVALLSALERYGLASLGVLRYFMVFSCILVAGNFAGAIAIGIPKLLVKKKIKSPFWGKTYTAYCAVSTVFWLCASFSTLKRE